MKTPSRRPAPLFRIATLSLAAALACVGCGPPPLVMSDQEGATRERDETDEVATVLSALRPDTLGFAEEIDSAVRQMNRWAERSESLGEGVPGEVSELRFSEADARHVRDRLLDAAVVDGLIEDIPDDLGRVRRLFEHVCRQVELTRSDATPRTTFEVRLIGRGTASERAWLFADLVRQLKLECALLTPTRSEGWTPPQEGGRFVVAVFVDGRAYLFDPRAGLPVPAPGQPIPVDPGEVVPATYAEVLADPSLLAFAGGEPWSVEEIGDTYPVIVNTMSDSREAIDAFAAMLPADVTAVLYDPFERTPEGPGVADRLRTVTEQVGIDMDTFGLWTNYESITAFEAIDGTEADRLAIAMLPFDAPVGEDGPEREQLAARLAHLRGEIGAAIKAYQLIRVDGSPASLRLLPDLTPRQQTMYRLAADDAHYWTALGQYTLGKDEAAVATLDGYLDGGGSRTAAAATLRALARARLGETESAAETLLELVEAGQADPGLGWLARGWAGEPAGTAETDADEPADDA